MPRRKSHEVTTSETLDVPPEASQEVADLDVAVQQDAAAAKEEPRLSVRDQLIEACRRAVDALPEDEILVRERLIAAIDRATKAPKLRRGPSLGGTPREGTKESLVIAMLQEGTTVAQIQEATGWQRHSTFGTLAHIKKKFGLNIVSEKPAEGDRTYHIVGLAD